MSFPRLTLLALALLISNAQAQDPSLQRRDTGAPTIPRLTPETLPPTTDTTLTVRSEDPSRSPSAYGEQEVLVRNAPWKIFSVNASAGYTYQTNAALSPISDEEDEVFSQSLGLSATVPFANFIPAPLLSSTYISLNIQEQTLRYRELDILDFDRVDTSATLIQLLPAEFVATLGSRYYRLSVPGDFDEELFANFSITAGLSRSFTLGRNSTLFIGANADVSLSASSEEARRDEYGILAAYTLKLAPRWEAGLTASINLLDYQGHEDLNYLAAASLDYVPRDWIRIGASVSYALSESNLDAFDYDNITTGPSIRASIRF